METDGMARRSKHEYLRTIHPRYAQWLPWMRPRLALTAELERQLLAISPRQMDRRLQPRKQTLKRRLYGTTRPESLLKHQIPIKTDHWDVQTPGYLEIDLVSHSGAAASGEFLHTLDSVDIQTCWVERQAVRGKGRHGVVQAMTTIEQQLPFPLRGIRQRVHQRASLGLLPTTSGAGHPVHPLAPL